MKRVELNLSEEVAERLAVLGEVGSVVMALVDHAQQGVYRPLAWEREWLDQAFGTEWHKRMETDPEATYFQRPKR